MQHMQRCIGLGAGGLFGGQGVFENAGLYDDGRADPRFQAVSLLVMSRKPGCRNSTCFFRCCSAVHSSFSSGFGPMSHLIVSQTDLASSRRHSVTPVYTLTLLLTHTPHSQAPL